MTRASFVRRATSPILWPFVLLYAMAIRLKNATYRTHLIRPQQLSWPVVSVGNLSVGGTGKTPMVILLARLFSERGWAVDVLSRGYGRSSRSVTRVDSRGSAAEFGDEPMLMARHGISVYVGADRQQPGLLAEKHAMLNASEPRVHILDDGFQHRKLARTVDIVLLQRADLQDDMLPVGRLREPLSALERADILVLRAEDAELVDRVRQLARKPDAACIWIMERRTTVPTISQPASRMLAFCGIGDAKGFFRGLCQAGAFIQREMAFRDHHVYTRQDVEVLKAQAKNAGAQCFITTEKDRVRLVDDLRAELEAALPLMVAGLEVSLQEEDRCMAMLEELLARRLQISHDNVR